MKKTKILVTGGAGFIGSHLVERLINLDFEVFVIDDLSKGKLQNLNSKAVFLKANIESREFIKLLARIKPQIIFHLAAQSSISKSLKDPEKDFQVNLLATVKLLEKAKEFDVKKIIFTSSAAVFGLASTLPLYEDHPKQPISSYGLSKLCAEYFFQYYYKSYQMSYVCLRLANVYGPRQDSSGEGGVVAIFCNRIIQNKPVVIFGDGKQTRDFIHVSDVVGACIKALKNNIVGEFNIGTATETSVLTLYQKLLKLSELEVKEIFRPLPYLEVKRNALSYQRFNTVTDWEPTVPLDLGLKKTFDYFKSLQ